ncbi:AP-4 complex accessory subunit tepsin [Chionoecetes opilio]|uniref:AP-4 complex accessory subunit tepsin n=1 Tax=Chionoecetes opilio TaxID=41210 RepID=A0A8J4YS79_CHIOP|nr:AP-4 complex accessory subunit tepsin [Chionoecetes opilio]
MELLKEAKNVVDFASYFVVASLTLQELSHHSAGHRQLLVDFLLSRLHSSSCPGKQKVIRTFQQLCTRGHRGVRVSLRGQDGALRKAAATGGPPDPLLANTPQLFLSSAIQELLTQLFDSKTVKEDEQWLAGGGSSSMSVATQGYGCHGVKGKYEGFGSSPNAPSESLVTQVRGMVERVMATSGDTNTLDLLKGDKGEYQPLSLPSLGSVPPSQPATQPHIHLSASQKSKYKVHRRGRAGGGWDSDESPDPMEEGAVSPLTSDPDLSPSLAPTSSLSSEAHSGAAEDHLLNTLTDSKTRWPLDHDKLVSMSQECVALNLSLLLAKISSKCLVLATNTNEPSVVEAASDNLHCAFLLGDTRASQSLVGPDAETRATQLLSLLLLVEFGMHYDVLPPALVHSHLGNTLVTVKESKRLESAVRIKARKLSLIISKCI